MKRNNTGNKYNPIVKALKQKINPKLTDLFTVMLKQGKNVDSSDLVENIQKDYKKDLNDFLQKRNIGGKYDDIIKTYSKNNNIYELFKFINKNKKNIDYPQIYNKINNEDDDNPTPMKYLMDVIDELKTSDEGVLHLHNRIKNQPN